MQLSPQPIFAGTDNILTSACFVDEENNQLVCNGTVNQVMLMRADATDAIAVDDSLCFVVRVVSFAGPSIKVQHNTRTVQTISSAGVFDVTIAANSTSPYLRLTCDADFTLAAEHVFSLFSVDRD